ncbi:hypothetical protein ISCGN_002613 [Ixodes scapularis]
MIAQGLLVCLAAAAVSGGFVGHGGYGGHGGFAVLGHGGYGGFGGFGGYGGYGGHGFGGYGHGLGYGATFAAPVVAKAPVAVAHKVAVDVVAPQANKFGYNIVDNYGNHQSRHEVSDAHNRRVGSYSFTDAHGRARKVSYVADGHGFRAVVHTNEPGTAASRPAAAAYNTPVVHKVAAAPVVAVGYGHGGYGHGGFGGYGGYHG